MARKKLQGTVVSDAMDKTIVVASERYVKNAKYGKYARKVKRYKVHDENNECKKGDKVFIESCRPVSKNKSFKVLRKI